MQSLIIRYFNKNLEIIIISLITSISGGLVASIMFVQWEKRQRRKKWQQVVPRLTKEGIYVYVRLLANLLVTFKISIDYPFKLSEFTKDLSIKSTVEILLRQIKTIDSFVNEKGLDKFFKKEKVDWPQFLQHIQNERSFLEGFITRALGFSVIERPNIIANAYNLNDAIDAITMAVIQQYHFINNPFGDKEPITFLHQALGLYLNEIIKLSKEFLNIPDKKFLKRNRNIKKQKK